MNILEYIKIHQNEDFKTFPFKEIDNLILSLLAYLDFNEIVPPFKGIPITLKEAAEKLENKPSVNKGIFISNTYKMVKLMAKTKRYQDIKLINYMNIVNEEMQFKALTCIIDYTTIFVAYGGTDTSIIGWKEDFKMAYLYPGISQRYATIYLKKVIKPHHKLVRVGGHSKGGNLAICAVMNAPFYIRQKVKRISNFDGPGFLKEQVENKKYKRISNKITMYIPSYSVIGMILYHNIEVRVIKAKGLSILKHDAFNWLCDAQNFIRTKQDKRSLALSLKLQKKLDSLSLETKINLIEKIFNIFQDNNIKDTKEITLKKIYTLIKSFHNLDRETKNLFIELLIILFT